MEYKMIIHNATKELPKESGSYLVQTSDVFDCWQILNYSTKHKQFNTYDSLDNDDDAIKGYLWAELPEVDDE